MRLIYFIVSRSLLGLKDCLMTVISEVNVNDLNLKLRLVNFIKPLAAAVTVAFFFMMLLFFQGILYLSLVFYLCFLTYLIELSYLIVVNDYWWELPLFRFGRADN